MRKQYRRNRETVIGYLCGSIINFIESFEVPVSLMNLMYLSFLIFFPRIISITFRKINCRSESEIKYGIFAIYDNFSAQPCDKPISYAFIVGPHQKIIIFRERDQKLVIGLSQCFILSCYNFNCLIDNVPCNIFHRSPSYNHTIGKVESDRGRCNQLFVTMPNFISSSFVYPQLYFQHSIR